MRMRYLFLEAEEEKCLLEDLQEFIMSSDDTGVFCNGGNI